MMMNNSFKKCSCVARATSCTMRITTRVTRIERTTPSKVCFVDVLLFFSVKYYVFMIQRTLGPIYKWIWAPPNAYVTFHKKKLTKYCELIF